jgi:hypothetical protein
MVRILTFMLLAIVLFSLAGCASVGTYFKDRALDLADPFMLRVAGGWCSGYIQVTRFGPAVFAGFSISDKAGFIGRDFATSQEMNGGLIAIGGRAYWNSSSYTEEIGYLKDGATYGIIGLSDGLWEGIISGFSFDTKQRTFFSVGNRHGAVGPANPFICMQEKKSFIHMFWIEAELVCFVGINVGFNPIQFADFILGWFGIDIADDDTKPEVVRPPEILPNPVK